TSSTSPPAVQPARGVSPLRRLRYRAPLRQGVSRARRELAERVRATAPPLRLVRAADEQRRIEGRSPYSARETFPNRPSQVTVPLKIPPLPLLSNFHILSRSFLRFLLETVQQDHAVAFRSCSENSIN